MERGKTQGVQTALYEFAELLNILYTGEDGMDEQNELCALGDEAQALFETSSVQVQNVSTAQDMEDDGKQIDELPGMEDMANVLCASDNPPESEDFLMGI